MAVGHCRRARWAAVRVSGIGKASVKGEETEGGRRDDLRGAETASGVGGKRN